MTIIEYLLPEAVDNLASMVKLAVKSYFVFLYISLYVYIIGFSLIIVTKMWQP